MPNAWATKTVLNVLNSKAAVNKDNNKDNNNNNNNDNNNDNNNNDKMKDQVRGNGSH